MAVVSLSTSVVGLKVALPHCTVEPSLLKLIVAAEPNALKPLVPPVICTFVAPGTEGPCKQARVLKFQNAPVNSQKHGRECTRVIETQDTAVDGVVPPAILAFALLFVLAPLSVRTPVPVLIRRRPLLPLESAKVPPKVVLVLSEPTVSVVSVLVVF